VSRPGGRRLLSARCAPGVALAVLLAAAAVTGGPATAADGATHHTLLRAAGPRALGPRATDPTGTPLFHETFTGVTADEFIGYNEACLTGAPEPATPPAGDHVLGGCERTELGPVPPLDAAPGRAGGGATFGAGGGALLPPNGAPPPPIWPGMNCARASDGAAPSKATVTEARSNSIRIPRVKLSLD